MQHENPCRKAADSALIVSGGVATPVRGLGNGPKERAWLRKNQATDGPRQNSPCMRSETVTRKSLVGNALASCSDREFEAAPRLLQRGRDGEEPLPYSAVTETRAGTGGGSGRGKEALPKAVHDVVRGGRPWRHPLLERAA
jgi:hypothetical protein